MSKKWQTFKTSIKQLSPFISPYKWGFFTAMFMVIVTCFALSVSPMVEGMMTSLLMKNAMDIANKVEGAGVEFDKVMQIMMVLLGLYLLKTASQSVTTITLTNSIQNAMHDLRNALQDKIRKLPVSYFDTHQYGDILSRITNDVDTLSNALQQTLTEMIRGTLMLILAIIMMFNINVFMTFVVLLIIPAALFITKVIVKRSQRKFQAQQDALGKLNGAITEMYTGYNEILLFNKQQQSIDKFKDINENLCQNAFQAQFMSSIISPCISLVTYIIIGTIGFLGSLFAMQGKLLIGELQAFVRYIWQVNDPISQVSNLSSQIQSADSTTTIDITLTHPERMASRILGMGDMLSLIEKAQETFDEEKAAKLEKKIKKNEFTLEDFLDQMGQINKMGGLGKMIGMLPGLGANKISDEDIEKGEQEFKQMEAIIYSMTLEERRNPSLLNASRRKRIAAGSGQPVSKINNLIKKYEDTKKLMKQFSNPGFMKKNKRFKGLF